MAMVRRPKRGVAGAVATGCSRLRDAPVLNRDPAGFARRALRTRIYAAVPTDQQGARTLGALQCAATGGGCASRITRPLRSRSPRFSSMLELPCGASPPRDRALLAQLVEHFHGK